MWGRTLLLWFIVLCSFVNGKAAGTLENKAAQAFFWKFDAAEFNYGKNDAFTPTKEVDGAVFDGENDFITIKSRPEFDLSSPNGFALEMRFKPGVKMSDPKRLRVELINKGADSDNQGGWTLNWDNHGNDKGALGFSFTGRDGEKYSTCSSIVRMPPGEWQDAAVVGVNGEIMILLNGKTVGKSQASSLPAPNIAPLTIGKYIFNDFHFAGTIEEIVISTPARKIEGVGKGVVSGTNVLYESDFKKTTGEWTPLAGQWVPAQGGYAEFSDKVTAAGMWSVTGLPGWRNYVFEADIHALDNVGNVLLGFRWRDMDNHYQVEYEVIPAGVAIVRISKVKGGSKTVIAGASSAENKNVPMTITQKMTRFRIETCGELIALFIDGRHILHASDNVFPEGAVALGVDGRKCVFSNVKVTKINEASYKADIPKPENKPYVIRFNQKDFRGAFRRGETIAGTIVILNNSGRSSGNVRGEVVVDNGVGLVSAYDVVEILSGGSASNGFALDTSRLKAGEYAMRVDLKDKAGATLASEKFDLFIARKVGMDAYKYHVWGGQNDEKAMQDYIAHGLNGICLSVGLNSDFQEIKKYLAPTFDFALKHGMDVGVHYDSSWAPAMLRDDVKVVKADGSKGQLPNPWNEFHRNYALKKMGELMAQFKDYPSLGFALLSSENEDCMEPSFSPEDRLRAKEELGFDMPSPENKNQMIDGVSGMELKVPESVKKTQAHVFPDDDKWYHFLKWFWQRGFGDNILNSELAAVIRKTRPDVETTHDPFRDVALFRRNMGLDYVGTWFYSQPSPLEAAFQVEVLKAAAQGDSLKVALGPSLWLYSGSICPAKDSCAGVQPKDYVMEALWLCLSRRPDRLEHFGVDFVREDSSVEYQQPELYECMSQFAHNILAPYWPMLCKLEQKPQDCALLLSFASDIYSTERSWGGTGTGTANGYFVALQMAHIPAAVVFEENILRGDLRKYRTLFTHNLNYLPEGVFKKIVEFAKAGGTVVTGETFAAKIPGAICFDLNLDKWKNLSYYNITKGKSGTAEELQVDMRGKAQALRDKFARNINVGVDCDSPEVLFNVLRNGGVDYIFAINDKRVYGDYVGKYKAALENGLPQKAKITINAPNRFVYDLMERKLLPTSCAEGKTTIEVDLPAAAGKILAVYPEKIGGLRIDMPKAIKCGEITAIKIGVKTEAGKPMPGVQPIQVVIDDPSGKESEFSDYHAAENGGLVINFMPAINDLKGKWTLRARELSSGIVATYDFMVD